jgi:large subunit ribosomal protein L24
MPTVPPIKKNDQVFILRGKDRGKTGRVLIVMPRDQKVVVEGIQMIRKHTRQNPQKNVKGGIIDKEAPIHISNVALICANCKTHTRAGSKELGDGRRVRSCKKCGNALE